MFHVKYFTTFAAYKQKTNKCMKNLSLKTLALGILALFAVTTVSAQEEPAKKKNKFGLANRIGVGVGYGTEGLGFDVAIPLTQYVQVRATSSRTSSSTKILTWSTLARFRMLASRLLKTKYDLTLSSAEPMPT